MRNFATQGISLERGLVGEGPHEMQSPLHKSEGCLSNACSAVIFQYYDWTLIIIPIMSTKVYVTMVFKIQKIKWRLNMTHAELTIYDITTGINKVGPWICQFYSFNLECLNGPDWASRCTKTVCLSVMFSILVNYVRIKHT